MTDSILREFDALRRTIASPGATLSCVPPVVREIADTGEWATIVYSSCDGGEVEAVIDREIAFFNVKGIEFEWKVYEHDEPRDLKDRLALRGFDIGEEEALLALDLNDCSPALLAPGSSDVRRVDSLDALNDARKVWEAVFGKDFGFTFNEVKADLERGSGASAVFVAYDGGQPVSAGRCTFDEHSPFVGLYTGGTLASHRGRGIYKAVVAARAQEAIRRRKRYLTTDARPTSLPILLRHGFKRLSTTWPCVWKGKVLSPES